MIMMSGLTASPAWAALGWTMIHFLWIGGLLGVLAAAGRALMAGAAASTRYLFLLGCLGLMAAAPWIICWRLVATGAAPGTDPVTLAAEGRERNAPASRETTVVPAPGRSPAPGGPAADGAREAHGGEWLSRLALRLPWLWLAGASAMLSYLALGLSGTRRLRRACRDPGDEGLAERCRRLAASLRIGGGVQVALSERIRGPVLLGIVRPLILLPPAAIGGLSPEQVEMILLHELSHVRRRDNLVNLLQRVVESVLFFQPMVWLVSRWVRLERERACDDVVLGRIAHPRPYAEALARFAFGADLGSPAAVALSRHDAVARIRRILEQGAGGMRHSWLWPAAAAGLLALPCSAWLLLAAPAARDSGPRPFSFLRLADAGPEEAALETAIAVYRGPGGAEVRLVAGFPHGDPAYFRRLEEALLDCEAVLHDRVASRDGPERGLADLLLRLGWDVQDALHARLFGLASEERAVPLADPKFIFVPAPSPVEAAASPGPAGLFEREIEPLLRAVGHDVNVLAGYLREKLRRLDGREAPPELRPKVPSVLEALVARELVVANDVAWPPARCVSTRDGKLALATEVDGRSRAMVEKLRELLLAGRRRVAIYSQPGRMSELEAILASAGDFEPVRKEWLVAWDLAEDAGPGAGASPGEKPPGEEARRLRVLYLEGTPRWEYRYLKNALIRDAALQIRIYLWGAGPGFIQESSPGVPALEGPPRTLAELEEYDAVILGDVPGEALVAGEPPLVRLLARYVKDHGGGLVALAGGGFAVDSGIAGVLPVEFVAGADRPESRGARRLTLTEKGRESAVLRLKDDARESQETWEERLPGSVSHRLDARARADAETLALLPRAPGEEGRDVPVLVAGRSGKGKTFYAGIDDAWRWRAVADSLHFHRFWGQVIRSVARGAE